MEDGLHIRLLGEQELTLCGQRLALPPSKKTRALLGYLALSGRPVRRERLCELLWDVADDPRAALRWSLSKLRELVDSDGRARLLADREHVRLDLSGTFLDVAEARKLAEQPLSDVPTSRLEEVLALFRGELLEGLELPDFHAYYAFCAAEREVLRGLQARIVAELLERSASRPERALPLARRLVELDPASERARARFLQLLHASGREREAVAESRKSSRLLGAAPEPRPVPAAPEPCRAPDAHPDLFARGRCSETPQPMVGRSVELAQLRAWVRASGQGACVVLVTGEPGLGKSRLLEQLVRLERGTTTLLHRGAAHEVDLGFPYAPLRELLRIAAIPLDTAPTPELPRAEDVAHQRERLFRAASEWLERALAVASVERPGLLVLEDLHWFDEGSTMLLHHAVRACRSLPLAVVTTARAGELSDNAAMRRMLRSLRSEGLLRELSLAPLSRAEIDALVQGIAGPSARSEVYEESGGNPLFALELARAPARRAEGVPPSITLLVRERMEALGGEQLELLRWGSVLGARFQLELLEQLLSLDASPFVEVLEQLERLGWLCFDVDAKDGSWARFSHDIVHRAIYDGLSGPRRRLMHAKVARLLGEREADGPRAAELARHAVIGGDAEMAVRACLSAGRRCLRLFAVPDALRLVGHALDHVASLPLPQSCLLQIELHELAVRARRPGHDPALIETLSALSSRALELGELVHARIGFYLQAFLMWEEGQLSDAERFMREAERYSRLGEPRARLRGLSDAARCRCMLGGELTDAQGFVLEAEALVARGEPEIASVPLARGLLELSRGDFATARTALERAHVLARSEGDRLTEFFALEFRLELHVGAGDYPAALPVAEALVALGERIREGSEGPFARAAQALVRHALGSLERDALERAVAALRSVDAKARTAYVLVRWAELAFSRGERTLAREKAEAALALAEVVAEHSECALARSLLLTTSDDAARRAEHQRELERLLSGRLWARARQVAERMLEEGRAQRARKESHGTRDRRARLRAARDPR